MVKRKSRREEIAELADRLLDAAVRVGRVVCALPKDEFGRHVAGQLIRSGTSPAPNYEEACGAESRRDFAHKLSICLKELRETRVWLKMIIRAKLLEEHRVSPLLQEVTELTNITGKSLVTVRRNMGSKAKSKRPRAK